jgi:hypothetical protein
MKNNLSVLQIFLVLPAAAGILYFSSCHKEQVTVEERTQKKADVRLKVKSNNPGELSSAYCSFKVYLIESVPGHRPMGQFDCTGRGLCYVNNIIALPQAMPCPMFKIPDCSLVDCNNPWNFRNIFVQPLPRYKNYFNGNPDPNPNVDFVPIAVTSHIAVLQFYAELKGTLNSQSFTLPASFKLPKEVSKNLGLTGYTIPAGNYPVVFDTKNNTLNAIVYVK